MANRKTIKRRQIQSSARKGSRTLKKTKSQLIIKKKRKK